MNKKKRSALLAWLLDQEEEVRLDHLRKLSEEEKREFSTHWSLWARKDQIAPQGDWRIWLIMAGRGFGKTRAGAEWVRGVAEKEPGARIALVAASLVEARAIMVEGDSGLLAVCPPERCPSFEPSLRRLTWPNGAQATLFSALEPEGLRGPQHSHAFWPSSERSLCERIAWAHRCSGSLHCGRHGKHCSCKPGQWPGMACRWCANRRMAGPC